MRLGLGRGQDFLNVDPARHQRIRDQRAVASPRYRFGALNYGSLIRSQVNQFFQILVKLVCLHVIRKPAKTRIAPTRVDGITLRMAQSAKTGHVPVKDACRPQAAGKILPAELRITPGAGDGSDIQQLAYAVHIKDADELVNRTRGVTDSMNHVRQASR